MEGPTRWPHPTNAERANTLTLYKIAEGVWYRGRRAKRIPGGDPPRRRIRFDDSEVHDGYSTMGSGTAGGWWS
jgi:hypothetical protein